MRFFASLVVLIVLASTPVAAQDWDRYQNSRFGYAIDVPAGFAPEGEAPENGDGAVFVSREGSHLLRVYGGNLSSGNFADALGMAMDGATEAGWDLTYKRVTPKWASYSGLRDGRILYARAIAICGGTQFASYEFEYPEDNDRDLMDEVIRRLNRSLKPAGDALDC